MDKSAGRGSNACPPDERSFEVISFDPRVLTLAAPGDGQAHLLGSRCGACGKVFFPQQSLCTECFQEGTLKECSLGTRGKLYAFTIVERESLAPKGLYRPVLLRVRGAPRRSQGPF